MKGVIAALAAAVMLIANSAGAADMATKSPPPRLPPPSPIHSWTGCYAGAGIGYGMADINHSTTDPSGVTLDAGHDNGAKGWLGMLGAGRSSGLSKVGRWHYG
jgi:outer membrane immunogenic protein